MSNARGSLVRLAVGTCLALASAHAVAQSTATQIEDRQLQEVTVGAQRETSTAGLIQAEKAPKSRSTVSNEYLATQVAGQSVIQSLNLLPGVNFTNNDPYGASGGNLRMRSFDGPRISLMLDGMQLNDSGNYAMYTNQQIDSEIIERATVNLGATDVDSPTASATGGTINLITSRPLEMPGLMVQASGGSDDYQRLFMRGDTGSFGPWDTQAFVAASIQSYDKFKGPGELKKTQVNGRVYQDLGDDNFVSLAVHYNRNRNAFYRNLSLEDIAAHGYDFDNEPTCTRLTPGPGAQNEATTPTGSTPACTNYYGVRINPSNTGNVRMQSSFGLTDNLRLTIDPSYQYTQANGGGITLLSEKDRRLIGASSSAGVDLNGDGDTDDSTMLYTPNNTNTNRYGLNSSLIWTLNDTNLLRLAYTLDYARHRQTGQFGPLDEFGNPQNVFGGRDGTPVKSADGVDLRGRDRFSVAQLNQFSLSYISRMLDKRLLLNLGVRAPYFKRELNQYCYTATTGSGAGQAYCTSETPSAPDAQGQVTFAGVNGSYLQPFSGSKKYDKVLPNIGLSLRPWADANELYVSYTEGLSAPRTDNLYTVQILDVQPEKTNTCELGYRFQGARLTASTALWKTRYENRIVSAFDPDLGISTDRNVGTVNLWGVDSELGFRFTEAFSLYASASYDHSRVENDLQFNNTVFVPTAGKELVETPKWTLGSRAEYRAGPLVAGVQGKYVDKRWATDVNDQAAPAYAVFDADLRYDMPMFGLKDSWIQLNLTNLLDREYLGSIATSRFSADTTKPYGSVPLYAIGAPRTIQVSLGARF